MAGDDEQGKPIELEVASLTQLSRAAALGDAIADATRDVDMVLFALETVGWVLLREVPLGDVVVRRGVVGPGGIFAIAPRPGRWSVEDLVAVDADAAALAGALQLPREDVGALVVLRGSAQGPHSWHHEGIDGVVIGENMLLEWLMSLPPRLGEDTLRRLGRDLDAEGDRVRRPPPVMRPHQG
ncbi:hypothetical protein [Conexibacter sp. CPCC 206217]|uniref:hypothetical protein n=1 Tax=Conexibacter sp. CPCC 206217 TaxID=3064574 RepID=UPI002727690B|nr:hypothetical protein [Conexibacter sp. CPCC 206217]MDO8208998.1 hypothetical protein [Conexibacter sp. CPCC 206217]